MVMYIFNAYLWMREITLNKVGIFAINILYYVSLCRVDVKELIRY